MESIKNFIKIILNNPSGIFTENLEIAGKNYEIQIQCKRRITITLKPSGDIIKTTTTSEIKKSRLLSLISRYIQYSSRGKRTPLLEKLLSNKYTPPLLQYSSSKLICENNQISYTATIKKKNIVQLEKIINYFKALVVTSK